MPEGTTVPAKCCLMTVVNTDPKCYWLTNYLETLLVQVWYPMTVATNSREHKKIIASYFDKTGCSRDPAASAFLYKLVDFGFRGVSSVETAALGGAAHLCNFRATDTLAGIQMLKAYYNELDGNFIMPGNSIPAAEHSTITSWGRERESDALRNMLEQYPTGPVAVVSDSYNIYEACENKWGKELKSMIENRDGTLIVRPDSGEPKIIVVEVLEILGKAFGTSVNEKGYKMLPEYIRVIQGDGISYETLSEILENMVANQWAADNVTFGSGGALLQKLNRDTQKCAFKCSEVTKKGGETTLVYKDPITDQGKQVLHVDPDSPSQLPMPSSTQFPICHTPIGKSPGFLHTHVSHSHDLTQCESRLVFASFLFTVEKGPADRRARRVHREARDDH